MQRTNCVSIAWDFIWWWQFACCRLTVFIGRDLLATDQLEVLAHGGSLLPLFPSANPYFEQVVSVAGRESSGVGLTYRLLPNLVKTNWVCLFETMIARPKSAASPPLSFPDWVARLGADDLLTPGLREGVNGINSISRLPV
jgi:hypothetical protein